MRDQDPASRPSSLSKYKIKLGTETSSPEVELQNNWCYQNVIINE